MNEVLSEAIKDLNKRFGEQTVLRMSDAPPELFEVQIRPSGILQLDLALGAGGIPRGRTIEIYGPESSGKTTLALIMGAAFQAQDPECHVGFIDLEQTFDARYAQRLGIDPTRTLVSQPATGEEAIDVAYRLLLDGVDYIIIDSVSALLPSAEAKSEMDQNFIGLQARLMSRALRVLTPAMNKNKAKRSNVVFINQIREKTGGYGNPEVTSGGRALGFYASIRLCVRSGAKDDKLFRKVVDPFSGKTVDEEYGQRSRITVVKNKIGNPHGSCTFDLIFGIGPDKIRETLDIAVQLGIIHKAGGGNYSYTNNEGEDVKVRGEHNMLERLRTDQELYTEVRSKLEAKIHTGNIFVNSSAAEELLEQTYEGYDIV